MYVYHFLASVIWLEDAQFINVLHLCEMVEPGLTSRNFILHSTFQRFVVTEILISIRELSGSYLSRNT